MKDIVSDGCVGTKTVNLRFVKSLRKQDMYTKLLISLPKQNRYY